MKFVEIWWISWFLVKRGCLGGPAPRSLFFLRNIKVSEPPEYEKLVRNGEIREISWNLVKIHETSWFWLQIHEFCVFYIFFAFWSVSGRPGRVKNLNNPIGILRFSACGGQGTTRILQKLIFASFCRFSIFFAENGENLVILEKFVIFACFWCFGGSKPIKPWFWARNTKVSWRVAESRKSLNLMKFYDFHEFRIFALNFLISNELHRI